MVCKVLPCGGTHFEMLPLLPETDGLIHSILALMAGDHLKNQIRENCSNPAHIHRHLL